MTISQNAYDRKKILSRNRRTFIDKMCIYQSMRLNIGNLFQINFSKFKEDIEKMSDCKILYTIGKYTLRKNDVLSIVGRNWLTDQVL